MLKLIKKLFKIRNVGEYRLTVNGHGQYIVQELMSNGWGILEWVDVCGAYNTKKGAIGHLKWLQAERNEELKQSEERSRSSEMDNLRVEVTID